MDQSKIKRFVLNREVWVHGLFWLFLFSGINVEWGASWIYRIDADQGVLAFSIIFFASFFYANAFWLLPRYFKRKTWYIYPFMLGLAVGIPELFRIGVVSLFYSESADWLNVAGRELFSRDGLIFGTPSPMWIAFFISSAYYFVKNSWLTTRRIEQLEKDKLSMELSLLKSQVNPHFLFNNLNALDDLIDRDKQQAKEYLYRLSKILRYSISSMENDVVTLRDEWQAVEDYIYLIEERFGGAYRFEKVQDIQNLTDYLLPPASLQTLIENVVKHNQGSVEKPLVTTISLDKQSLSVSNPKRMKRKKATSLGTGLRNIKSRYQLLTNKEVTVVDADDFTVRLPLIEQVK